MYKLLRSTKNQLIIITVLVSLVYLNTFANQFVIDDFDFIVNWQASRSLGNLPQFFQGVVPTGHQGVYRPLRSVFYALSFKLWQLAPEGYHLQAILLHLACTILVYLIASRLWLIANRKTEKINDLRSATNYLPFLTALLFAVHPVHVEEVTYITASFDNFGILFFLSAFYFYIKGQESRVQSQVKKLLATRYQLLAIFLAFLAFLSYEMTLTLPLMIVLYELTLGVSSVKGQESRKQSFFSRLQTLATSLAMKTWPYLTGVIGYFLLKLTLTHNLHRGEYLGGSIYLTCLIMLKAFVKYLQLLVWPVDLSLIHILPGGIPTLGGVDIKPALLATLHLYDPNVLLGLTLLLGLTILALRLIRPQPLISFSLLWFLVALIPASQIIPIQVVMGEKYLYIPSVGFCLLLAILIQNLKVKIQKYNSKLKSLTFDFLIVLLIFTLCLLTFMRNMDWRSPESIWKNATVKASTSASAHYNLANIYQSEDKTDLAESEYHKSLAVDPDYSVSLNNLGFIYLNQNKLSDAEELFKHALKVKPDFYPMLFGLGMIYEKQGQDELAQQYFSQALTNNPNLVEAKQQLELLSNQKFENEDLRFRYPQGWTATPLYQGAQVKSPDSWLVNFNLRNLGNQTREDYLSSRPLKGQLINQGLAQIPNFEYSFVKVWKVGEVSKMQFFLFKQDKVIEILVSPSDSAQMKFFDQIVSSLKIK